VISLPATFAATHATAGLDGFPARDFFGSPRDLVRGEFYGRVSRISGKAPSLGGTPGGAYGRSVYISNDETGTIRYLTHLDELAVAVGDRVKPGSIIGTVCDARVSGKPGTTHVHYGLRRSFRVP
jgi:hypothetical protein